MSKTKNSKLYHACVLAASIAMLVLVPTTMFSQTSIRLVPGLGLQALQCYVNEAKDAEKGLRGYNFFATPSFSVSIQVDIKNNWMIFVGWSSHKSFISYKYGNGEKSTLSFNVPPSSNFPIGVHKRIGVHQWVNIGKSGLLNRLWPRPSTAKGNRYLFLFRSKIISGASYDLVKNVPGNMDSNRPRNVSVFFGLGLQFFKNNYDRLQLNFLYSQGVNEISNTRVNYSFEGKNYTGTIGTRGSFIAIQAAYPLQIVKFKNDGNRSK